MQFELIGHDNLFGRYPAPVIPIGRLGAALVAAYPSTDSPLDPQLDEIEGDEWVRHSTVLQSKLVRFDYRCDRLFAFARDDVDYYESASENETFRDFLEDPRFVYGDPFIRLVLARQTKEPKVVFKEVAACLLKLSVESPCFAQVWCREELLNILSELDTAEVKTPNGSRNKSILIVDDQRDLARLLGWHFETLGYKVFIHHDGSGALSIIRQNKPDLVLLDLMMPGINGLSVLEQVKADPVCAATRIIVISARTVIPNKDIALRKGAIQYLSKTAGLLEIQKQAEAVLAGP